MRLSEEEIQTIKQSVFSLDPFAKVFLFGSRTDDLQKGGDIDLLIESDQLIQSDIHRIKWDFYEKFGEQKMDIIIDDQKNKNPFIPIARKKAIVL